MRTFFGCVAIVGVILLGFAIRVVYLGSQPAALPEHSPAVAQAATLKQFFDPKQCAKGIREAEKADLIRSYDYSDGLATVVVGNRYGAADFEVKDGVNVAVRCAITDGHMDTETLRFILYQDPRGHRKVATWDKSSGLEIE